MLVGAAREGGGVQVAAAEPQADSTSTGSVTSGLLPLRRQAPAPAASASMVKVPAAQPAGSTTSTVTAPGLS